jgi:hypothetical protein
MENIIKKILEPRIQEKDFSEIIECFDKKNETAKTIYSAVNLNNYFRDGMGKETAMLKLIAEGLIETEYPLSTLKCNTQPPPPASKRGRLAAPS